MEKPRYPRIFCIVADAVGIGEQPDAAAFDDVGADTLGSITHHFGKRLHIPVLTRLGLGNIREDHPLENVAPVAHPLAAFGKMTITSNGCDSTDGHWEMMCLPIRFDMAHFPEGFPPHIVEALERFSGRKMLVNLPYSGTEVLKDYGEEACKQGAVILYTSGDSVLQLAAHTSVVPLQELYALCEYARTLINGPEIVMGRVIARPFVGTCANDYKRTDERRDYGLEPHEKTALDLLSDAGYDVFGIGKISDLFAGHGITKSWHNESNMDGMNHVDEALGLDFCGLCFVNLVDFDTEFGHRRDVEGEGRALMELDERLARVLEELHDDDLLIITADHGNDPCYKGTDHTREYVPLLVYSKTMKTPGYNLGVRKTAADLGKTVLDNFGLASEATCGTSFLQHIY